MLYWNDDVLDRTFKPIAALIHYLEQHYFDVAGNQHKNICLLNTSTLDIKYFLSHFLKKKNEPSCSARVFISSKILSKLINTLREFV